MLSETLSPTIRGLFVFNESVKENSKIIFDTESHKKDYKIVIYLFRDLTQY